MLAFWFWLHLIGVTLWVGASMLLPLVIMPAVQLLEPAARSVFTENMGKRMLPIVSVSILVVLISGIEQTRIVYGFQYLLSINTLTIKIFVFLLMAANGFYLGMLTRRIPALAPKGAPPSPEFLKAQRSLIRHSWIQAGMSVIMLLIVGILTA
jgi:uncharacterized membrane protein